MYNTNNALPGVCCDHTKPLYNNVIYLNCQMRVTYKIMCSKTLCQPIYAAGKVRTKTG